MTNAPNKFFELNEAQISELISLAAFHPNDVFYDLGSGEGKTVIEVAKVSNVKRSIGIEHYVEPSEKGKRAAIADLSPAQQRKLSFWYGEIDAKLHDGCNFTYDLDDAKVLYFSHHEDMETLEYFKERFPEKRLRIITKDLPLVGYPSEANRYDADCWFFLTQWPLRNKARITSKNKWAESVLGVLGVNLEQVGSYFGGQLSKRKAYSKKDVIDSLLELDRLINERF
jgi:hypothetical protein